MPRKLTTDEEIKEAWDKKRERDKKAQARWVEANREEHKKRMREQYQKRKAKAQGKKAEEEAQAKAGEARQEVVVPVMEAPAPAPEPAKECEVKEVPAGLSLLEVVKRIRNSYYASLRNKAGWKGKSEEWREQWKKDFVFCDDLVAKNEDKLTPEHKAELTARGIALTDPRLIAKELDEGIFTAPIAEKKAPVRRKLRKVVEVPKEEPAPAPAPAPAPEPEPEKKAPVRRKRKLAVKEPVVEAPAPEPAPAPAPEVDELPETPENTTRPNDGKIDHYGAIYRIKDILEEHYKSKRPYQYRTKPAPQSYRDANPEKFDLKLQAPADDYFVKELPKRLTPRQLHEITQKVYKHYLKSYLDEEKNKGNEFRVVLRRLLLEYRKVHGLGDIVYAVENAVEKDE